jgi:flagellar basal body rod protein FlgG
VFLNPSMSAALDRIAERAADVRRAFTPGAVPQNNDVATAAPASQFTLDPLSASAPPGAYFTTRDDRGGVAYTRDGCFHLDNGVLTGENGRAILGAQTPGAAISELRIDPVDAALGRARNLRIEADGTLAYDRSSIDPRTGLRESTRVAAGRVALARFPAGTHLDTSDGTELHAPPGVVPHTGAAGDGTFGLLAPLQREKSRVDIDTSLLRLREAYVAFDALQAAETARGRLGKTAMDLVK